MRSTPTLPNSPTPGRYSQCERRRLHKQEIDILPPSVGDHVKPQSVRGVQGDRRLGREVEALHRQRESVGLVVNKLLVVIFLL